jgi:predicted ABC-type ATPase
VFTSLGPNGAGKTTFAREFLPNYADCKNFINADLIAQGVSPFSPEAAAFHAGRLMLEEIDLHAKRGEKLTDDYQRYLCSVSWTGDGKFVYV